MVFTDRISGFMLTEQKKGLVGVTLTGKKSYATDRESMGINCNP